MAPPFKRGSISKSKRGQSKTQRGDLAGSKHGTAAELLQSSAYWPAGNLGKAEPMQPPGKSPPGVIQRSNTLEEVEGPKIYYPKEKEAIDKGPDSAPLLPKMYSLSEVIGQPFRAVRKVSSTPRLRDDLNRVAALRNSSPASSVGSAETPQEDYCPTIPKLDGIILGSPDLSLTTKGTCGTRGSGKVIVPERKVSSVQGSMEIGDVEEAVCDCSSTVTPRRTSSENNTETSLPGQNLQLSSLQLPPRPPTPMEFRQRSQSQGASSQSSFFSRGRSIIRARRVRNPGRNSAKCDISRGQRVPFSVPPSIRSLQNHYMAPETSLDQGCNLTEQPEPAIDSPKMIPRILSGEVPHNEILSQLKILTENVADIKIEQMRINEQIEDTNTHLKKFSEELQLENDARVRSLAAYEASINSHITQVAGTLGEAVESVAITVAKMSDTTANIGPGNSKSSEGHDLKWSDAVEHEACAASARTPPSTHVTLSDKCYTGPSTIHNRGKSLGNDVGKENFGSPIGRGRSQTNPSTTSRDQGQEGPSIWRGPPPSQKRGFWKRHRGGMSWRGSASGGGKYTIANSVGQQPPIPVALQAQEVTPPNSYTQFHMHGGYEDQSHIHPAARIPDPSATRGQASGQQSRFPPRQSSMRHNHSFMRSGAGPSSRSYMPHRDFSSNYGSPLPQSGQGQSQPAFHHVQAPQNPGNNPLGGQWPVANPEANNTYRPWAGVSNWYHQVNHQGNSNMRSPPS